jgi:hypothetical protein
MGIYHFMGLGQSLGAVTAAVSYMAACKQIGGETFQKLFALSGETSHPEAHRGDVQALILFTTPENRGGQEKCLPFYANEPGQTRGREQPSRSTAPALRNILAKELTPIARQRDGSSLPVELYWCDIALDRPVQTFERVAQVLAAAKRPGTQGHEIWINLTGGNNILNTSLQLATSLLGTPARMYYLLTKETCCIRHTIPNIQIDPGNDRFWIDLPIVYLNFSPLHLRLLEWMGLDPEQSVSAQQLHQWLMEDPEAEQLLQNTGVGVGKVKEFVYSFIQPLKAQKLLVTQGNEQFRLGIESWQRMERYLKALPNANGETPHLSELTRKKDWFHKDEDLITT